MKTPGSAVLALVVGALLVVGDPVAAGSTRIADGGGGLRREAQVDRQRAVVLRMQSPDSLDVRPLPRGPARRVRLIGIDAPMPNDVAGAESECGGREAWSAMARLLGEQTRVLLVSDPTRGDKDLNGQLLRYVVKGSRDLGRTLLTRGHARVDSQHSFRRRERYEAAQEAAQRAGRGLWGHCSTEGSTP